MAGTDVEIVKRCLAAYLADDYDTAMSYLADDVVYDLRDFPDGEVYRGHDGVREAFRIWLGAWEDYRQEIDEIVALGDQVLVCSRERGRGKGSGIQLERPQHALWTLAGDKVTSMEFFARREDAVAAAAGS